MKYNIIDWKGYKLFKGKEFNNAQEGWDYVDIINYPEEVFVVKSEKEISKTVVTQNNRGSKELRSLYPDLNKVIKRFDKENKRRKKKSTTVTALFPDPKVWLMWYQLGK